MTTVRLRVSLAGRFEGVPDCIVMRVGRHAYELDAKQASGIAAMLMNAVCELDEYMERGSAWLPSRKEHGEN